MRGVKVGIVTRSKWSRENEGRDSSGSNGK